MRLSHSIYFLIAIGTLFASCEKYLDLPPKGRMVPELAADFRKLLDNQQDLNSSGGILELGTDNISFDDLSFQGLSKVYEKGSYVWEKKLFTSLDQVLDWNIPYRQTFNANLVLEGLEKNNSGTEKERNTLKGEALFYRAWGLFSVATTFCVPFDSATAATDLGAPIRLSSNVFELSKRPTLQATYDQVIKDLKEAITLLPDNSEYKTRPVKPAAFALLSRVYLAAGNYDLALEHGLNALAVNDDLLDYNTVDPQGYPVFPKFHSELLFFCRTGFEVQYTWMANVNNDLYDMYEDNDLRKELFFFKLVNSGVTTIKMNASYGDYQPFSGIANDEVYLTVAECYARKKQLPLALEYFNKLMKNRYVINSYTDFNDADELVVLKKILEERRKELPFRFLRWFDLRRLNKDPRLAVTLTRTVGGKSYTLAPNDPRYTYPVPQNVIDATGIEQNQR